ncbi:hypothetical protein TKK_0001123 [Trichogramma kaykai]|uniref:5-hydroxyisourate hydrolase n=1 Tax=Trichogramma kaykai TaxID=54128 RepID=A0ABD2WSV8_9HYME
MSETKLNISTHILDVSKGIPVKDVKVKLYKLNMNENNESWIFISDCVTNSDGRIPNFEIGRSPSAVGVYKLNFAVKNYYDSIDSKTFYPFIDVNFSVDKLEHYHIPLLLNAFGYTTYRGS